MKHKDFTDLKVVTANELNFFTGYEMLEVINCQQVYNSSGAMQRDQHGNYFTPTTAPVVANDPKFLIGLPKDQAVHNLFEELKKVGTELREAKEQVSLFKADRDQAIKREQQAIHKFNEAEERIAKNAEEYWNLKKKHDQAESSLKDLKKAIGEIQFNKIVGSKDGN